MTPWLTWMYAGYVWLTNVVPPRGTVERLLLLVGMGGFLVVALAIPEAFGEDGLAFGLAYLVVMLVHTVLGEVQMAALVLLLALLVAVEKRSLARRLDDGVGRDPGASG